MRVCVIGGGLFGCTAAIYAAHAGHDVHLFEAKPQLMLGATAGTYSRLHRGAHYPRSPHTGRESRRAERSFRADYGAAVIDGGRQFYVVPASGSHVSGEEFRRFLDDEGLAFSEVGDHVFQVTEPRVNLQALQVLVRQKVRDAGVAVHLGAPAPANLRQHCDQIVVAAYSSMNHVLVELGCEPQEHRYQVVEKPVVLLPECFTGTSVVVIDGPFGCVDPLDDTPLHVLGHVVRTVHAQNTGLVAEVPEHLAPLVDRGLIRNPPVTRLGEALEDLARYIPELHGAVHVGSMFTVRAVLAHQEATDARPTLLTRVDKQVSTIFSGKLGTCVAVARELCDSLGSDQRVAA